MGEFSCTSICPMCLTDSLEEEKISKSQTIDGKRIVGLLVQLTGVYAVICMHCTRDILNKFRSLGEGK
ncbi:hypothetical protein [Pendulispora albinea]|uniref:Uncharacterized protein n=1 Tax=Pendulispora albinea TaxID=2741071 RepID=A0ABZ2M200_9BACT